MNPKIAKPHDKFFREIWSDREVALDFLENYLPAEIRSVADMDTLEIQKDTFVEKRLRDYYSDILYRVNLADEPGFIHLLFEHKSFPYRWIHLQVQRYMLNIWELLLKQEKETRRLPLVIPMVIYHGREEWGQKRRFREVFSGPVDKLSRYVPDFEYILYDLSHLSDEKIRGAVLLRAVLLMMKHIFDPKIHHRLPRIFRLLRELSDTERGLRSLEILLRYLFDQVPDLTKEQAEAMMGEDISRMKKEVFMTVAEQLRREGFESGLQLGVEKGEKEGEKKGIRIGLLNAIEQGLDIRFGADGLKLMPRIRNIRNIDRLKAVHAGLYRAKDVAELHDILDHKA